MKTRFPAKIASGKKDKSGKIKERSMDNEQGRMECWNNGKWSDGKNNKNILWKPGYDRNFTLMNSGEKNLKTDGENELLLASIPSIMIAVDKNDLIFRWNRSAELTFGLCSTEIMGKPFSAFSLKYGSEKIISGVNRCQTEGRSIFLQEIRFKRKNNQNGFLNVAISPIFSQNNEKTGFLILANDITGFKFQGTQSVRSQKLETISTLAAKLAHEINTPIQYVSDNTIFLQQTFDDLHKLLNKYVLLFKAVNQHSDTTSCSVEIEEFNNKIDTAYLLNEIPKSINENIEGIQKITNIVKTIQDLSENGEEGNFRTIDDGAAGRWTMDDRRWYGRVMDC